MPPKTRSRLLYVDDDEDASEMLRELLRPYGIDVTCAQSAVAAWPIIKAKHFDLYLLDAWLPNLNGFQLCREIREFDSKTPTVFYSGAAYEADRRQGIEAGANAYVSKPDIERLIEVILDLIADARAKNLAPSWIGGALDPVELFPRFFALKTASN